VKPKLGALPLILGLAFAAPSPGQTDVARLERKAPEFSLFGGYGLSVHVNRGRTDERLLVLQPQAAFRLGSRFQYVIEGHLARYFHPDGFAAGFVPLGARYFFGSGGAAPYFGLGVGLCWTNLRIEELDRRFNFVLQGGVGVRGNARADRGWMLEARWLHYSNAGTELPNLGFNAVVLLGGWRFR
jgi:Lipid A 3-O-deacylase (PagL)